jgi:hypothetical protein
MSDGSKEKTVEKSTDELLSETDDILGEVDGGGADAGAAGGPSDASGSDASLDDAMSGLDTEGTSTDRTAGASADADTGSATVDDRGFRKYFAPKSAGVSGVLLLAGALLGGVVPIPFVGGVTRLLAVGAAAFLHGTTASDSRYAETFVASGVVGAGIAVVTNPLLTFTGIGIPLVAMSTVATMLVALVGHYFGRDLRAGLTQDVGGGGGGGGDDVPGW